MLCRTRSGTIVRVNYRPILAFVFVHMNWRTRRRTTRTTAAGKSDNRVSDKKGSGDEFLHESLLLMSI